MINLKKYAFRKYSEKFPLLFRMEKAKLRKILPNAEIEHAGSTSVPGLGGKGIIDVTVSVPRKYLTSAFLKLKKEGYNHRPSGGDKYRKFFQRIVKHHGDERRIHVHLTYENSRAWKAHIAIREYLRKHKDVAKKYSKIKKAGVRYAKGESLKYREYKDVFVKNLEKKALKEFKNLVL